jgi:hypothetical protein
MLPPYAGFDDEVPFANLPAWAVPAGFGLLALAAIGVITWPERTGGRKRKQRANGDKGLSVRDKTPSDGLADDVNPETS